MDIQRLVIANPSGNITAIVYDPTAREHMRDVGAKIQSAFPSVEQVLFVEDDGVRVHGQMAGGEFCGNAARALGYVLANGRDGQQTFTMSGTASPVTVHVKKDQAAVTARMALQVKNTNFEDAPVSIVHLEGISHAIMPCEHPLYNFLKRNAARPDRWRTVTHILEDLDIVDKPASGLIFAERDGKQIRITPYVFVKDIKTLYPEMACASGSIAAAVVMGGAEATSDVGISIRQPSEEDLKVALLSVGAGQTEISVAGSMSILWDGPAEDLHYSAASLLGRHGGAQNLPTKRARLAL